MSVNLGTVHASIELRLDKLKASIRDAKGEFSSLESDTKRRAERIGQTLTSLGRSMSIGITAPLVLMGKSAVESAVRMDSLTRSLTSLTGDSKETEKQLIRLREAAKLPGLGFRELIEGSVRLQSAGLSARQAEDALKGFGNALALAGGSKEDLREVGVQLAQIASSGKLQGDELRIIAERVPQVRAVLKEAFGTASSEEIAKYGLSVEQLLGKITDGLNKLPQATDSVQNKFDNFNDTLDDLKRTVGTAFLPAVTQGLEIMARKVEEATKWFNDLEPAAKKSLGQLAVGGALMGPVLAGLGALFAMFSKLAGSPFFKFLSGKLPIVGPLSALAVDYKGPTEMQERALSFLPPAQQAAIRKGLADAEAERVRAENQREAMRDFTYDPFTGKVRKKILPENPLGPRFGTRKSTGGKSVADSAREARREARRRLSADLDLAAELSGEEAQILREAQRLRNEGRAEHLVQKFLMQKMEPINRKRNEIMMGNVLRRGREETKDVPSIGRIPSLMGLKGIPFGGESPWQKFGNWLQNRPPNVAPESGGLSMLSAAAMGAGMAPKSAAPRQIEMQAKPTIQKLSFNLGQELGNNMAMEMGREFGMMFDKVFGTGNPLSRALSRTLSRLVDDLMFSLAQRALGSKLILSLFGGAAGGMAGTGTGAAAGMTGAALMGGGAKAAAAKAGTIAGVSFGTAFALAAGAIIVAGSMLKNPGSARSQKLRYGMALPGSPMSGYFDKGDPRIHSNNINFYGAQFNNDQDPERAATRMAWHLDQRMRSRPGS